jgi:arylsulfatase A-like enzyme
MSRRRPNVIVFFTDQQRHDTTGVHGCPLGLTPNFDRVAMRGTHLVNNFTCQPVCAPARACLQTGLYATQAGVWRNGMTPAPHLRTLAHHFNAAGYHTGYIGKWHLAPREFRAAVPLEYRGGYQSWLAANVLESESDAYDTHLWDEEGREHKLPGYRVDALTDAAIRHIDAHQEHPFFLFLSYLEPHHQNHCDDYPAPVGYADRYTGSWMPPDLASLVGTASQHWPGYCGMVKRLDEAFGRLLDALRSLDLLKDTIVLFTSDHGNHFKTRNGEYKRSCHEASIRTPAALCGPGFDGRGALTQLVSTVDLAPTLLDAAGIAVPKEMSGHSLVPLLRDRDTAPWPDDVLVQISETQTGRAIRTSRWKYSARRPGGNDFAEEPAGSDVYADEFLYDLQADPWELTNLVGMPTYAGIVAELRERLVRRMREAGEAAPRFLNAEEQFLEQRQVDYPGATDAITVAKPPARVAAAGRVRPG